MSKKLRNSIIAVVLLLAVAVGALLVWQHFRPQPQAGGKSIVFTVVHGDESTREISIRTDAENLRGALEQESLIAGDESEYGLFVKTVDGETANDEDQEWWCFTKGGEMLMTGVDDTMIADGESYEATLTVGW